MGPESDAYTIFGRGAAAKYFHRTPLLPEKPALKGAKGERGGVMGRGWKRGEGKVQKKSGDRRDDEPL